MRTHGFAVPIGLLFCVLMVAHAARATQVADGEGDLVKRGEYLARAADCTACHTAPGGRPFAGGLSIHSPVGVIVATNITPSTEFGIGAYTEEEFSRAIRRGVRADGSNLYPAMPYTSYAVLTDDDVHALYVYFQKGVAAVEVPATQTDLPFPFDIRLSMKAWNLLFLNNHPYQLDSTQSVEWNRGKYLVTGAAHCGECHTPRGFLMNLEDGRQLSGGQVDAWHAPNVTPDEISGIGNWSSDEVVRYLHTGSVRHRAQAAGSMGQAVEDSLQYLSPKDLMAVAVYLRTVPKIRSSKDPSSRFGLGAAFSAVASMRGTHPIAAEPTGVDGELLFQANCSSCHSIAGQGSADGYFPSLFDNSATGAPGPDNLIAVIINGVNRTTARGQAYMPGFGGAPNDLASLTDAQVVALAQYVQVHYGSTQNLASITDVEQVRQGGPGSHLLAIARISMGVGVIFFFAACILFFRRRSRVVNHAN